MIVRYVWNRRRFSGLRLWTFVKLFCFDMAVVAAYTFLGWTWLATPHIPIAIIGGALSVLIGFRNANAYQRWWEARTLWGSLVNSSRILGRQANSLIFIPNRDSEGGLGREELTVIRQRIVYHQIAFVNALRCQLRGQEPWQELAAFLPAAEVASLRGKKSVPVELHDRISALLRDCFDRGWIDSVRWAAIENTLAAVANAQGGAERIKNTPLPRQYDLLPRVFTMLYCVLLPFGIVADLGVLTPIGSSLIGLVLLIWDQTGTNLENPFENEENDVPLTAICRTIEISLKQQLGEAVLPEPLLPVEGVLQ